MWIGMTPVVDRGFVTKLRLFDPDLWVEFNRELECFVIMQPSRQYGSAVAHVVRPYHDGHPYRQPNEYDLAELARNDFARRSPKEQVWDGENYMRAEAEKSERKAREDIRDATKDDRRQLANAYIRSYNLGKASSTYSKINHKPGKNTIMVNDKRMEPGNNAAPTSTP